MDYYFSDQIGTTQLSTNPSGAVCYDSASTPFGYQMVYTPTCAQDFDFAGMQLDSETGNYHTWYRQYEPNLGRWMSPDRVAGSVANPQSLNLYTYALNNPLSLVDPTGLNYCPPAILTTTEDGGPPSWAFEMCVSDEDYWDLVKIDSEMYSSWIYVILATSDAGANGDNADYLDSLWGGGGASAGAGTPAAGSNVTLGFLIAGGGASAGAGTPAAANNKPCTTGFGAGVTVGADAVAGLGYGAGGNVSAGAGLFGGNGINGGAFASGGAGASAFGHGASAPGASLIDRLFLGLVGGAGGGIFITNASQASQLGGLSGTWNVDFGDIINGAAQFSAGKDSAGNNIWSFSFTLGVGLGAGYHNITNKTVTAGRKGGC